jgi:predicted O-methyltransferase YrrM
MDIVNPDIEDYLARLLPSRDEILEEMERRASERRFPIVGPAVGRLLAQWVRLIKARRVFEFGSGFGYSAYWFAKGMEGSGKVVFTDDDPENARRALEYFRRAGMEASLQIETGDALEIIDREPGPFDVLFIDCDKERYPEAFGKSLPRLRPGGLMIADNVLWGGSVLRPSGEPSVLGIQKFNHLTTTTPGLLTSILPLRDGVSVSLKL